MSKHQIVTPASFVITEDALGEYVPNGSYADISDVAGKTVLELLNNHAWILRQRNDLLAERAQTRIDLGQAQHARVQAERKLTDAKTAFKTAMAVLLEESAAPVQPAAQSWVFTASNGIELSCSKDGSVRGPNSGTDGWPGAMLELFAADRQNQQFTWRWPEDENLVVIRNEGRDLKGQSRWVHAFDERTIAAGHSWYCSDRSRIDPERNEQLHLAAHAYFDTVPYLLAD